MILKNSKGQERSFRLLLNINKDNKDYLIYKDNITGNLYSSRKKEKNKLVSLDDKEYELLNKVIDKINS